MSTDLNKVPSLFGQAAFRDLVVSTLATYGSYFICSFAYLEPWHMVRIVFLIAVFPVWFADDHDFNQPSLDDILHPIPPPPPFLRQHPHGLRM